MPIRVLKLTLIDYTFYSKNKCHIILFTFLDYNVMLNCQQRLTLIVTLFKSTYRLTLIVVGVFKYSMNSFIGAINKSMHTIFVDIITIINSCKI